MISGGRLLSILVAATLSAVGISVWAFVEQGPDGRDNVLQELVKVTWQFLLVAVLGGFITYLLQERQARAAQEKETENNRIAEEKAGERKRFAEEEAMDAFRSEMVRRTVAVTNAVRRVPLLVSARRSYRTYDEQMRTVIDSYLDLRAVRHEIDNLGLDDNAAFYDWRKIRGSMRDMEDYLASLTAEFAGDESKDISELQIQAEQDRSRQPEVWDRLRNLPALGDMLLERPNSREPGKQPTATDYYANFVKPYGEVLSFMRAQLLRHPPSLG